MGNVKALLVPLASAEVGAVVSSPRATNITPRCRRRAYIGSILHRASISLATITLCGACSGVDLQYALAQHEKAWNSVASLDMHYTQRWEFPHGDRPAMEEKDLRWSFDGERMRLIFRDPGPGLFHNDWFLSGDTLHFLLKPKNPHAESPTMCNRNQFSGRIQPGMRGSIDQERLPQLLRSFAFASGRDTTLSQLCREWDASLDPEEEPSHPDCVHVRASCRSTDPHDPRAGNILHVFLDPSANYMARKAVLYEKKHGTKDGSPVDGVKQFIVESFTTGDGSPIVPERVRYEMVSDVAGETTVSDATPNIVVTWTATKLAVNRDLPRDTFDFAFPEHTMVREFAHDGKLLRISLWGADGRAAKSYETAEEMEKYLKTQCGDAQTPPRPSDTGSWISFRLATTVTGVVIIVLAVAVTRRRLTVP